MSNRAFEFSGKTVEDAIQEGLHSLGLREDAVEIEILNKGSRGIFGLGSEPALIRMRPRQEKHPVAPPPITTPTPVAPAVTPAADNQPTDDDELDALRDPSAHVYDDTGSDYGDEGHVASGDAVDVTDDELVTMASEMLTKLVALMGFEAEIEASWHEADENGAPYLLLDIRGHDLGSLIGRRGETLASLQYLLRLMVNQRLRQWKNIVVDVEQYKHRRVTQLTQLAERMARQVLESGRAVTLEPMPSNERRIVHLTLRDHPNVFTESIGEGDRRKVTIVPKR